MERALRAGQKVDFEPLNLIVDLRQRGQQGRDSDQCAQVRCHALAEIERGKQRCAKSPGDQVVHERYGQVDSRNECEHPERNEPSGAELGPQAHRQGYRQQGHGDDHAGADIAADAQRARHTDDPASRRGLEPDLSAEALPTAGDQIVAGVRATLVRPVGCLGLRAPGGRHGGFRDLKLGEVRASRQFLDAAAVQISGRKIHLVEAATRLEHLIDEADALEQLRPIDVGDEPHAGEDVSNGNAAGDLALVFAANDRIRAGPLAGHLLVEPCQGGRNTRILVAEPMNQLHQETV